MDGSDHPLLQLHFANIRTLCSLSGSIGKRRVRLGGT